MILTALCLLLWGIVTLRFAKSPLYGSLWFLFSLSFIPRYIAIGLGQEGFALTAERLIFGTVIVFVVLKYFSGHKPISELNKTGITVTKTFVLLAVLAIFGVFEYGNLLITSTSFVEELVVLFVTIYIAWRLSKEENGFSLLLHYALFYPLVLTSLFVVVEMVTRQPVLAGIVNVDAINATFTGAGGVGFSYERDGVYRAKALFENPLILSEFAVYAFIAALGSVLTGVISRKHFVVYAVLALAVAIATTTRSSLLVLAVCSPALIAFFLVRRRQSAGRLLVWSGVICAGIVGLSALGLVIAELTNNPLEVWQIEDSGERSTFFRVMQYRIVPELVLESPIYGYGFQRNFPEYFVELVALDSYYFRTMLKVGFLGFALLLFVYFFIFRMMLRATFRGDQAGFIGFGLLLCMILYKFFVETGANNIYILLVFYFLCFTHETRRRRIRK